MQQVSTSYVFSHDSVHLCVCVCMLSHVCVQLFATIWAVAHQASLSLGFPRQEYWSGLPFPPPGDLPDPGMEPVSLVSQADSLSIEPRSKPSSVYTSMLLSQFVPPFSSPSLSTSYGPNLDVILCPVHRLEEDLTSELETWNLD